MSTNAIIVAIGKTDGGRWVHYDGEPEKVLPILTAEYVTHGWEAMRERVLRHNWSSLLNYEQVAPQDDTRYTLLDAVDQGCAYGYLLWPDHIDVYAVGVDGKMRRLDISQPWPERHPEPEYCTPLNVALGTPCPESPRWLLVYRSDEGLGTEIEQRVCQGHLVEETRLLSEGDPRGPRVVGITATPLDLL